MAEGDTQQTIYTEFYIASGKPATENETGYEALTWTKVAKPINLPERGDSQEDVSENALDTGRTEHFGGAVDGGELVVPFIAVEGSSAGTYDAGQQILIDSTGGNTTYSFKEVEPNGDICHAYYGRISPPKWREATASSLKGFSTTIRVNSARVTYDTSD